MAGDTIGEGEFGRFCMLIDRRLQDVGDKIDAVDEKVTSGFQRTNGRLDKAEDRLGAIERSGCALLPAHKAMIETIADRAPMSRPKQAGLVAGISSIVVGLIELARTVASHFLK